MNKETKLLIIVGIVALIIGLAFGYYYGDRTGTERGRLSANEELTALVDLVFPKPPEVVHSLGGVIQSVNGGTINVEVNDPDDYLPKLDGTGHKKEIRYALLKGDTEILLVDSTRVDNEGRSITTELKSSDLKSGDAIMMRSDENIRDAERFSVDRIELVKY